MTNRRRNRRGMAWAALVAGILFPFLVWVGDAERLTAIVTPFYAFVGTVVGAYVGFATLDDRWASEFKYDDKPPRKRTP